MVLILGAPGGRARWYATTVILAVLALVIGATLIGDGIAGLTA
jgi:hypothetical protein